MDTVSTSPETSDTTTDTSAPESSKESTPAPLKRRRGFACMTPEQRSAISKIGGKAAHAQGRAHCFTTEEARAAGKLGGVAPRRPRKKKPEVESSETKIETH